MDSLLPKSKVCTRCGEEKLLGEFNKEKKGKYGRESRCKVCRHAQENKQKKAEYTKQYYETNKEKIAEQQKKYQQNNKEKIKKQRTERIKTEVQSLIDNDLLPKNKICTKCGKEKLLEEFHRDKSGKYGRKYQCKLCKKQYREANKERSSEYTKQYKEKRKQYLQDNKEKINEWARTRRKNDVQFRIRNDISSDLAHSLRNVGKTKNASTLTYIGCTIEFMKEHLNSTKKPEWGDDLHMDHIIPKSLFDHTNEKEVKKCWNWRNLRYLPAKENISKGDTLDMGLVKSYGIEDLLP